MGKIEQNKGGKAKRDFKPKQQIDNKKFQNYPKRVDKSLDRQKHAIKVKYQQKKDTKARLAAEAEAERKRIQTEKEVRIKNSKKKRLERTKAISKKTKRGQPLMKDRMQLLLKQIEEMKGRT